MSLFYWVLAFVAVMALFNFAVIFSSLEGMIVSAFLGAATLGAFIFWVVT